MLLISFKNKKNKKNHQPCFLAEYWTVPMAKVFSLVLKAVHASELPSAQILSVWSFGFVVCLFTVSVIVLWSVSFFPLSVSRPMSSIFSSVICVAMFASAIT